VIRILKIYKNAKIYTKETLEHGPVTVLELSSALLHLVLEPAHALSKRGNHFVKKNVAGGGEK